MSAPDAMTAAQRAVLYHAGEVYKATWNMHTAYLVDTGKTPRAILEWDALSFKEQVAFMQACQDPFVVVITAMVLVGARP